MGEKGSNYGSVTSRGTVPAPVVTDKGLGVKQGSLGGGVTPDPGAANAGIAGGVKK